MTKEQKTFDSTSDEIEFLICDVSNLWRKVLNFHTKILNVSNVERRILATIGRNPGWTQVQIAHYIDLEPQNLIRILDKFESQGWIEKRANPNDRRVKCLYVTAIAEPILEQIAAVRHQVRPDLLAGIPASEMESLTATLNEIKINLSNHLEACAKNSPRLK